MTGTPLQPFRQGDRVTARRLNQIVSRVNPITHISTVGNSSIHTSSTSTAINTQHRPIIPTAPSADVGTTFPAAIISSTALIVRNTTYTTRWAYGWQQVDLLAVSASTSGGHMYRGTTGGMSGTTTSNFAVNLNELNHGNDPGGGAAWYLSGINANGANYPDGFALRPIGGGGTTATHKAIVMVMMFRITANNGTEQFYFDKVNSHDGIC